MLTSVWNSPQAPDWLLPALVAIFVISAVGGLIKSVGSSINVIASLKVLASSFSSVSSRTAEPAQRLTGPIDLDQQGLATAIVSNQLIATITTMIARIQVARVAGSSVPPEQYLTSRLLGHWNDVEKLPGGPIQLLDLHARPLSSASQGDRIMVWFRWQDWRATPHLEYWTFTTSAPLCGVPATCPNCGAPTGGSSSGVCVYCHSSLVTASAPGSAPAVWLVDDISPTPPKQAAA